MIMVYQDYRGATNALQLDNAFILAKLLRLMFIGPAK